MELITRQDAVKQKLRRFFTGRPCRHGHLAERYTTNGACVVCTTQRVAEERQAIREALRG